MSSSKDFFSGTTETKKSCCCFFVLIKHFVSKLWRWDGGRKEEEDGLPTFLARSCPITNLSKAHPHLHQQTNNYHLHHHHPKRSFVRSDRQTRSGFQDLDKLTDGIWVSKPRQTDRRMHRLTELIYKISLFI